MEADFNFAKKMMCGVRIMDNVRKHYMIPEEIFSEKGKTADNGLLAKVLFFDIIRQSCVAAALPTVTAALLLP